MKAKTKAEKAETAGDKVEEKGRRGHASADYSYKDKSGEWEARRVWIFCFEEMENGQHLKNYCFIFYMYIKIL